MTIKEFGYISDLIKETYAKEQILRTKEAMEIWYEMLKDLPFEPVIVGLKKWFATEKWSPTIADIREMAVSVSTGDMPDWSQGWSEVQTAIRRYGYMQETKALASMSPQTAEAVKRIGWQAICESENPETLRAQFRQIFELTDARAKEQAVLPESVKSAISQFQIGQPKELKQLGGG